MLFTDMHTRVSTYGMRFIESDVAADGQSHWTNQPPESNARESSSFRPQK